MCAECVLNARWWMTPCSCMARAYSQMPPRMTSSRSASSSMQWMKPKSA